MRTWGWLWIRVEFAMAILAIGLTGFFWVVMSGTGGGLGEPSPWVTIVPLAGASGVVVGLAWMIHIARKARPGTDPL